MKFGISMFTTDQSASPMEVAKLVEDHGFDSFWLSEHSNMPLSTDFPLGDEIPREYSSMLDPFVALAAAAAATSRIKLGTAICLVTQRDPINCAKAVASIDHISNGRMLFGIGAGWNEPEMRNHGTDPSTRFRLMRERVEAMKALWTQEAAEYHGRLVDFEATLQWPKPVQKPHPPVLVAGAAGNILKRVVAYGDGWLPVVVAEGTDQTKGRMTSLAELETMVPELNAMAAAAGKPNPSITASGMGLEPAALEKMQELGIERLILRLTPEPLEVITDQVKAHAANVKASLAFQGNWLPEFK